MRCQLEDGSGGGSRGHPRLHPASLCRCLAAGYGLLARRGRFRARDHALRPPGKLHHLDGRDQHVRIVGPEVHDTVAVFILDIRLADRPLVRHSPGESLCTPRDRVEPKAVQILGQQTQRLARAGSCQGPGDGLQASFELVAPCPRVLTEGRGDRGAVTRCHTETPWLRRTG